MKYFLDTEFIERFNLDGEHVIDLISIGIVCEDGRKFYRISREFRYDNASEWVRNNVLKPLYEETVKLADADPRAKVEDFQQYYGLLNSQIAGAIRNFIDEGCDPRNEFYGYFADYDWVLFCSLFGTMMDLPPNFPMYCRDLKQMVDDKIINFATYNGGDWKVAVNWLKNHPKYPKNDNAHNALSDAEWNLKLYQFLEG